MEVRSPGAAGGGDRLAVEPTAQPFDAAATYRAGVRTVALHRPVDLADPRPADVYTLDVVRRATAQGLSVSWTLSALPPELELPLLSHLHPPDHIDRPSGTDDLDSWWDGFYLGRCCWRQGPGFIQVRDRRHGSLARYTVTEPALTRLLGSLDAGGRVVEPAVAAPLVEEGLVLPLGGLAWLAPYRLVRWPSPAMGV